MINIIAVLLFTHPPVPNYVDRDLALLSLTIETEQPAVS